MDPLSYFCINGIVGRLRLGFTWVRILTQILTKIGILIRNQILKFGFSLGLGFSLGIRFSSLDSHLCLDSHLDSVQILIWVQILTQIGIHTWVGILIRDWIFIWLQGHVQI